MILGIIMFAAVMFYFGYITGYRHRAEKFYKALALIEAKLRSDIMKGKG